MMKTVLFVPGFSENLQSRKYPLLLKTIESKGYKMVFVPINWKRSTINDWVQELENVYRNYRPQETILAGFSYGSLTALLTATKRLPAELWLFSLSPYFAEDLPGLKAVWLTQIGKRRIAAFEKISFQSVYPEISCPVKLFAGGNESDQLLHRFEEASAAFMDCEPIVVPNTLHAVDAPAYITAIKQSI